jgi:TonB family protein
MKRAIVLTLLLLASGASVLAQKDLTKERVSLRFKDTPVSQVFGPLAKSLGYELHLSPFMTSKTSEPVLSIQVDNITAQTALNVLCESIGCRWWLEGKRLRVVREGTVILGPSAKGASVPFGHAHEPVWSLNEELWSDITWLQVDIPNAFSHFASMLAAELDIAPALRYRKLTVDIKNATLRQALDAMCAAAGCRWELLEQPKRILRVTDSGGRGEEVPAADWTRVFDAKEAGVKPPVMVAEVKPLYTAEAMRAKIEGKVRLSIVVLPDGSVGEAKIVESLTSAFGLDREALMAARRWRFTPGTKDGHPVAVRIEIEMLFTLRFP